MEIKISRISELTDLSPHVQALNGSGLSLHAPEKQITPDKNNNIIFADGPDIKTTDGLHTTDVLNNIPANLSTRLTMCFRQISYKHLVFFDSSLTCLIIFDREASYLSYFTPWERIWMGNTEMFTGQKFISSLNQPNLLLVTSSSYIYGIDRINFTIPARHPYSLAQDSNNGNIFVTRVSEVTKVSLGPNGTIKSEVIAGMEGPGNNDGSLETAQFGSLDNIIILAESKLLVMDSTNHNLKTP